MKARETCSHWRVTLRVTIVKDHETVTFKHHSTGIPGTKNQAVRKLKKVCATFWPSADLRLLGARPDRIAEGKEVKA